MKTKEHPDVYNLGTHYLDSSAGSPPAVLNEIWRALQRAGAIQLAKPNTYEPEEEDDDASE